MTHNTPEGLPPLPELPSAAIGLPWRMNDTDGTIVSSAFTGRQVHAYAEAYAREALRAQAAGVVPVGEVREDKRTGKVYIATIGDADLSPGDKLYASAPPAHVPADVEAASPADMEVYDVIAQRYFGDTRPTPSPAQAVGDLADIVRQFIDIHDKSAVIMGARMVAAGLTQVTVAGAQGEILLKADALVTKARAALAARQPQAQQGGGEVRESLKRMLAVFKAATKDRVYTADVAGLLAADIQALTDFATKDRS